MIPDSERLVGEPAKRQAVTNADNTISSIKRDMGTDKKRNISDKKYSPQEISAMILQKLKAQLFVVPKSIPMILLIMFLLLTIRNVFIVLYCQ